MTSLAEKLSEIVGAAFEAEGLPAELGAVRVSNRPDLCQFQCNGAMAAAKYAMPNNASGVASDAKKNPREIAQIIVETLKGVALPPQFILHNSNGGEGGNGLDENALDENALDENALDENALDELGEQDGSGCELGRSIFTKIEIAGPGFINLDVTDAVLAAHLSQSAGGQRLGVSESGVGQTIVLDYGGPNIAKPMHVGHLRSSIIGDTLRRICKFAGYKTIGDVHMGDWGLQMGMILSALEIEGDNAPITMERLQEIYPKAAAACKEDEARMEAARAATRKLQDGDEKYTKRWREFIDVSIAGMKKNFDALGVHFDEWKGEADAHPFIAPMVEGLKAKGVAIESDGALVIRVEEEADKKEMPPLILLKSDGAVMYGTTDLGTIVDRVQEHNPAKIIYVVDQRQSLHFEQVFRVARKGGLVEASVELTHAGFGTMNGQDGKPFKTRAGGVMKLEDLISMGIEKAQSRLDEVNLDREITDDERAGIAHKVAIAAIKFSDLQNNRISDYVFDLDQMTSFEGKTGPYLLYQAVRIKSLLMKAQAQGLEVGDEFVIEDEDRSLALLLTELPDHFETALRNYTPHVLCDYAFKLAQGFSSFYAACHILSEGNEALRASRLALCDLTQRQLTLILDLLGIDVPERM